MTTPPYVVNIQHRDGNPNKSQWSIPVADEQASFVLAHSRGWLLTDNGWSYHVRNDVVDYLGYAVPHRGIPIEHRRKLLLAKFVASGTPLVWHGYPADPQNNRHDVPDIAIRRQWLMEDVLPPQFVRKVGRQQSC